MKIVLDALGGDFAPVETVKGAVQAAAQYAHCEIILVGDEQALKAELSKYGKHKNISIVHAADNIEMKEHPLQAIRSKKNCSINVGLRLVREGKADSFVSAGNTGAVMASALFTLGRVKGVERPALATVFPTKKDNCVIVDVGANSECRPNHLVQFAQMGRLYAQLVLGKLDPTVRLLSIGEEDEKGNELTVATNALLRQQPKLNFKGNAEGKDIFEGVADVIVCDGFVGNVVLKLAEGIFSTLKRMIIDSVKKNLLAILGVLLMAPAMKKLLKKLDYTEYGGAPLLGVDGICIITHGRAKAKTIKNAIRAANYAAEHQYVERLRELELAGAKNAA